MISYNTGIRIAQLSFAVTIFGLSVALARGQVIESVPSETLYAVFVGGLGIVAALLGVAATSESSQNGPLNWVVDGVTGLALLVGGIVFAVRLRRARCSSWFTTYHNVLLCGGCNYDSQGIRSNCWYDSAHLKSRCFSAIADTVFMFLAFVVCIGALVATDARGARRSWRPIWRTQRVQLKVEQ